jgi:hypothetical protein
LIVNGNLTTLIWVGCGTLLFYTGSFRLHLPPLLVLEFLFIAILVGHPSYRKKPGWWRPEYDAKPSWWIRGARCVDRLKAFIWINVGVAIVIAGVNWSTLHPLVIALGAVAVLIALVFIEVRLLH